MVGGEGMFSPSTIFAMSGFIVLSGLSSQSIKDSAFRVAQSLDRRVDFADNRTTSGSSRNCGAQSAGAACTEVLNEGTPPIQRSRRGVNHARPDLREGGDGHIPLRFHGQPLETRGTSQGMMHDATVTLRSDGSCGVGDVKPRPRHRWLHPPNRRAAIRRPLRRCCLHAHRNSFAGPANRGSRRGRSIRCWPPPDRTAVG